MDTRVLIMVADFANKAELEVVGASAVIRELFEQHRLLGKINLQD